MKHLSGKWHKIMSHCVEEETELWLSSLCRTVDCYIHSCAFLYF